MARLLKQTDKPMAMGYVLTSMQEKRKVIKQAHNNFATLLFTFGEKRTL
jgi:hypothetical protein